MSQNWQSKEKTSVFEWVQRGFFCVWERGSVSHSPQWKRYKREKEKDTSGFGNLSFCSQWLNSLLWWKSVKQRPGAWKVTESQWFSESEWLWLPCPSLKGERLKKKKTEQWKDGKRGNCTVVTVWEERERRGLKSMNLCMIKLQEALRRGKDCKQDAVYSLF